MTRRWTRSPVGWAFTVALVVGLSVSLVSAVGHCQTVSSTVANDYRKAAEVWRGNWAAEKVRRTAAETEAAEQEERAGRWKAVADALEAEREHKVPLGWLWPTAAVVVIGAFAAGFALGLSRPHAQ